MLGFIPKVGPRKRKLEGVVNKAAGGVWKRHKSGCSPLLQVVGRVKLME